MVPIERENRGIESQPPLRASGSGSRDSSFRICDRFSIECLLLLFGLTFSALCPSQSPDDDVSSFSSSSSTISLLSPQCIFGSEGGRAELLPERSGEKKEGRRAGVVEINENSVNEEPSFRKRP